MPQIVVKNSDDNNNMNLEIDSFDQVPVHRDDSSLQVSCRSSFLGAVSPISCSDEKPDFGEFRSMQDAISGHSKIDSVESEQKKELTSPELPRLTVDRVDLPAKQEKKEEVSSGRRRSWDKLSPIRAPPVDFCSDEEDQQQQ